MVATNNRPARTSISCLYNPNVSLALATDAYMIAMAHCYWKNGMADTPAVFQYFFRKNPFSGGYTLTNGLEATVDFVERLRYDQSDLDHLATKKGYDSKRRLYQDDFLHYLGDLRIDVDMDAMPESTLAFPFEPVNRVKGRLICAQLLESPMLICNNFATLIATKASRVKYAAGLDRVVEYGFRRAQGLDGAFTASRAAYCAGCDGTSNELICKLLGIPSSGTQGHSQILTRILQLNGFRNFGRANPTNTVFLLDTIGTKQGIKDAIVVALEMREMGYEVIGVRLDSGDLTYWSKYCRRELDKAGLHKVIVIGENELDEYLIASLKRQGAKIGVYGVGTKLITAYDDAALGGVYKLVGIDDEDNPGNWRYPIKLSDDSVKISNPGFQQVRRFMKGNKYAGDMIYDEWHPPTGSKYRVIDQTDPIARQKEFSARATHEDVLKPVLRGGNCVYDFPELATVRERGLSEVKRLDTSILRLENPHRYPAGLEFGMYQHRSALIQYVRSTGRQASSTTKLS
jgi:nicotinate phosphoribosyltransferase